MAWRLESHAARASERLTPPRLRLQGVAVVKLHFAGLPGLPAQRKTEKMKSRKEKQVQNIEASDSEKAGRSTFESVRELVAAYGKAQEDNSESGDHAREACEQEILNDALSVEVRSDWVAVGGEFQPTEYRIVLGFGGPNTEIIGELDEHNQPSTAKIRHSWATPWAFLPIDSDEEEILLTFARVFYFGE